MEGADVSLGGSIQVPSVQELAKKQLKAVPSRYVRTDQDPIIFNANTQLDIPVVDLNRLLDGDLGVTNIFDKACREWGFFQLTNHGVSTLLLDEVIKTTQEFFKMPLEEKKKFAQEAGDLEGYGQAFVVSETQKLDWADILIALEAYSVQLKSTAMKLFNSMAKCLKIDPEEMVTMFEDSYQSVRMNYYPPCPEPDKVIGLAPHSDPSGLTILLQLSEMEGLQVRKDDTWITVKPLPDAFIVNIGDILEIITNGSYRSIEHRAICNSVEERISIATFLSPLMEREFGPAPSLLSSETPPRFLRTTTSNYYKGFFARELRGKSHLDTIRI